MKKILNLINAGIAASTISGVATNLMADSSDRIIEFKSGPEGFDTRTFFYESENEVIAFDSQFTPDLARKSIKHLRNFTKKPISVLIITHPNPDKFNGASVFKEEGARIISSKSTSEAIPNVHAYKEYYFVEMAKMFKKGEYPQPIPVDETFEKSLEISLQNGQKILLKELSQSGVSSTQTVAYLETIHSLFVGDLVHYKAHAWLEGGIVNGKPTPNVEAWINDLNELNSLFPPYTDVYGGRGLNAKLTTVVKEQTEYLLRAKELIKQDLIKRGKEAQDYKGPKAAELYKKLSELFQKTFPDYSLPYLIEYGSYGLLLSELEKLK